MRSASARARSPRARALLHRDPAGDQAGALAALGAPALALVESVEHGRAAGLDAEPRFTHRPAGEGVARALDMLVRSLESRVRAASTPARPRRPQPCARRVVAAPSGS